VFSARIAYPIRPVIVAFRAEVARGDVKSLSVHRTSTRLAEVVERRRLWLTRAALLHGWWAITTKIPDASSRSCFFRLAAVAIGSRRGTGCVHQQKLSGSVANGACDTQDVVLDRATGRCRRVQRSLRSFQMAPRFSADAQPIFVQL